MNLHIAPILSQRNNTQSANKNSSSAFSEYFPLFIAFFRNSRQQSWHVRASQQIIFKSYFFWTRAVCDMKNSTILASCRRSCICNHAYTHISHALKIIKFLRLIGGGIFLAIRHRAHGLVEDEREKETSVCCGLPD